MASLLPSDVTLPTPVADTITAYIASKSGFLASAAAGANFDAGAALGGSFFTMGRWKEDTAADEIIDGSASTPGNVGSVADISPVLRRKRVRAIVDGVDAAMGSFLSQSPSDEILAQAGAYWARRIDEAFVQTLTGFFDASAGVLRTTHKLSKGVTSGSVVTASFSNMVDAGALAGDNFADLAVAVMHSKVWADLRKEAGAKANYVAIGNVMVPFYDGLRVVLSDNVPTSGSSTYKKYTTILLRPGALYLATQQAMREIVEINATVPEVRITQTLHFACVAHGMKWNVTTVNPANTDLATATNWTKATSVDKEIGIVALETNAS